MNSPQKTSITHVLINIASLAANMKDQTNDI